MLAFLSKNGKWLKVDIDLLYRFTVWVARSKPEDKDFVLAATRELLENHLQSG